MHDDQVEITTSQVAGLVAEQIPALARLGVVRVESAGTVNAIFRISADVAARFPLRSADPTRLRARLRSEAAAATEFHLACPFPAPEPIHVGEPGHGYPLPWTAQTWLPGSTAAPTSDATSVALADDVDVLIEHLRDCGTRDRSFAGSGRGGVLADHDEWVDECIRRSSGLLDTSAMTSMWRGFRALPREDPDVMCHGDLTPANLLVQRGRLGGILDTGGFRAADPALDLVAAWHLFGAEARERLRDRLGCSELQWERGKAWAFEQAIGAYWYYRDTNPAMAAMGRTTLERLVGDAPRRRP